MSNTAVKWRAPSAAADFHVDLKRGKRGELEFFCLFDGKLDQLDGRRADFKILATGKTLELKMDYYDPAKTENLFFERFSSGEKLGGVWRSYGEGTDYYCYMFQKTKELFIFDVLQLTGFLNQYCENEVLILIPNRGYVTRGYKIPRSVIESMRLKPEDIGL